MNPGVDVACTGALPHATRGGERRVSVVATSVARPLTTSTSGISGAGLKKCMPTTRPGCSQPGGERSDRQRRRVGREDRLRRDDLFELAQQRALLGEILDDRLDDELRADAIAERRARRRSARCAAPPRRRSRACPWRPALAASARSSSAPVRQRPCRVSNSCTAMPGLRGDLRDAGAHRAGADDGDRRVARQCAGCRHRCPITSGEPRYRPLNRGGRLSRNAATPSR